MARVFAYPMKVNPNGVMATVEDGEDSYAQELAMNIQTMPGERTLVPEYGIEELTFSQFDQIDVESQVSMFGPPVVIEAVNVVIEDNATMVDVEFSTLEQENIDDERPLTDSTFNYRSVPTEFTRG